MDNNYYHPDNGYNPVNSEPAGRQETGESAAPVGGAYPAGQIPREQTFPDPTASNPVNGAYRMSYQPGTNVYRPDEPVGQYRRSAAPQGDYRYAAASAPQPEQKKGISPFGAVIVLMLCVAGVLAVWAGIRLASGALGKGSGDQKKPAESTVTLEVSESPSTNVEYIPFDGQKLTYAQIAAKFRSAVVSVTVYYDAYGWASYVYSEGSGFIIDEEGYIVTNSHVIDDDNHSQFKITVTIADDKGEMIEVEAKVVGNDARTDLAVLKIDPAGLDLVVSELGQSAALVLGDEVVAIGNPGGSQFAGSITNGIISGIDRVIDSDAGTADNAMKYLQTNAAINPGNSGGPLLNMYGQVIGINTAKIVDEGYESLGFSIPIDTALPIIRQIIEVGSVVRPALGISCDEITMQTAQWYDVPQGLLIRGFYSNSTLPAAGLERGDIIVACDGIETLTLVDLQNVIDTKAVGDTMELTVFRSGYAGTFNFTVELIADNDLGTLEQPGRP